MTTHNAKSDDIWTHRPTWNLTQLELDPLPRWRLLGAFEADAIAAGDVATIDRIGVLRARYLQWDDMPSLAARLSASLLAIDGLPARFDAETALDWLPPWVPRELADAWWAWREVMLRRGEPPAAEAAARTVGAPPRLLSGALTTWGQMHGELHASAAETQCVIAVEHWDEYVSRCDDCTPSSLLIEKLAHTKPVVWPAAPTYALWRLDGAAALLAARLQLAEHPIVLFQGESDDETLNELARALAHPSVSNLTTLARHGKQPAHAGGVRTLRVA